MPRGSFAPTPTSGGRGPGAGRRWADQPPDRPGAVHHPQDGQRPCLLDPGQAGRGRPWRGGRGRPPSRAGPVSGVRRWRWLAALAAVAVVVAGVVVLRTGDVADAPSRPKVEIREGGTVRATVLLEPSGFNPNTSKDEGVALQAVAVTMYPSVFRVHPDFSIRLDPTFMVAAVLTSHDPRPSPTGSDPTPAGRTARRSPPPTSTTSGGTATAPTSGPTRSRPLVMTGSSRSPGRRTARQSPSCSTRGSPTGRPLFANLLPAHYVGQQPGGWNRGLDKHPEDIPSGGPFKIAGFRRGETLTLARNDQYWVPGPTWTRS